VMTASPGRFTLTLYSLNNVSQEKE
jgi:hypothetical protein